MYDRISFEEKIEYTVKLHLCAFSFGIFGSDFGHFCPRGSSSFVSTDEE